LSRVRRGDKEHPGAVSIRDLHGAWHVDGGENRGAADERGPTQILGDSTGLLKLIFHRESRQLLGVHIIGAEAAELVHIGQAVLAFGGQVDYFVDTVFNYPTLAECYKTSAFNGINRLGLS
jgi:hypothetical protein